MKVTIPMKAYRKCSERAEFKRQMTSNGFRVTFHEKTEYPYIWDMYDKDEDPIEVVTIDSGIRKPDARQKLLDYLRDEYLEMSARKFVTLIKENVLVDDLEQPNTLFFNFRKLETLK